MNHLSWKKGTKTLTGYKREIRRVECEPQKLVCGCSLGRNRNNSKFLNLLHEFHDLWERRNQANSKDVTQVITIESKMIAVINQVHQEHSI